MKKILKKGEEDVLMSNVLSGLLAVFVILGLVFLGARLYNLFVSQDEKNAQAFLNGLMEKINNLEDGETGRFVLRGVEEWSLVGYKQADIGKCAFNNCICICPSVSDKEGQTNSCQDNGFCRKVEDKEIVLMANMSFDVRTNRGYANKGYIEWDCILLQKKLAEFLVIKDDTSVNISLGYGDVKIYSDYENIRDSLKSCITLVDDNPVYPAVGY